MKTIERKLWTIGLMISLFSGCANQRTEKGLSFEPAVKVETTDDYGYRTVFHRNEQGLRHGSYHRYNQAGQVVEKALYVRDTLHGERVLFYESGDTLSVETYDMGRFEGPFKQYYENGQLQLEGMYQDSEMTGSWRQYYDTGELLEVVFFENNEENGPFVEYYRNGNLKAEGNYLNGDNEHGLLKLYDQEGNLVRKMNCEKGVCRTIWTPEDAES